jgi:hypothetical protein
MAFESSISFTASLPFETAKYLDEFSKKHNLSLGKSAALILIDYFKNNNKGDVNEQKNNTIRR